MEFKWLENDEFEDHQKSLREKSSGKSKVLKVG
jgi:hypothetical protein